MPDDVKEPMIKATGDGLAELWGLTEGSFSSMLSEEIGLRMDSVGRPLPGCDLRIIDTGSGEDITGHGVGEIVGRCANIMDGYWRRPEADKKALWLVHDGAAFFELAI